MNHPHIAAIYGLEEAEGKPFLALELVEGEELKDRLEKGPIPVDEVLEIAEQIAEALEEAHAKGIVHRDLKPANVKLTPDGKVKVLDFGLAKAWSGEDPEGSSPSGALSQSPTLAHTGTVAGVILGTAAYMSPEQARGKPVDKRADVWSFGVLLWEILTLEKPLKNYTYTRLKNEIFIDGERPPIKKVFNKRMRDLISAGWSQKPSKRPTMAAVYDELRDEYLRLAPEIPASATAVSHNRRRSTFVARPVNRVSVRHLMRLNTVESDNSGEHGGAKKK